MVGFDLNLFEEERRYSRQDWGIAAFRVRIHSGGMRCLQNSRADAVGQYGFGKDFHGLDYGLTGPVGPNFH